MSRIITFASPFLKHCQPQARKLLGKNEPDELCTKAAMTRLPSENYLFNQAAAIRNAGRQELLPEVLHFIFDRLDQVGAPVAITWGTLLHEFRNGTGPCVVPRADDKDFDITVFEEHFKMIYDMRGEIQSKFGFYPKVRPGKLFMILQSPGQSKPGSGFQIDIYGFQWDHSNGLVYYPWDDVAVQMNLLLPFVKHKALPIDAMPSSNASRPLYHHRPFNPGCLLANEYGPDFMTPQQTKFYRRDAFNHSGDYEGCNKAMTVVEEKEYIR